MKRSSVKKADQSGKGAKSRKAFVISDDDSDIEDPLPKSFRSKTAEKGKAEKKRKARVLSDEDSDNEDPLPKSLRNKKTPPTLVVEPKKLKMDTAKPEKKEKQPEQTSSKRDSSQKSKREEKGKASPVTKDPAFKVPTPVAKEKSKSRINPTAQKRRPVAEEEDDSEEDFNPKKKAAASRSKPSSKSDKGKSKKPAKEKTELTDQQKDNFKKYLAKKNVQPKNLGSKDIPIGAPNCLKGLTFVMSGTLDSLEREDCKDLIEKYGGEVKGSVSKKTSYLIIGDDPGKSKVEKAVQLNVPQIDEDELLDMIRKSNPAGNSQDSGLPFSEDMAATDSEQFKTEDEESNKPLFGSPAVVGKGRKLTPQKLEPSKLSKQDPSKKKNQVEEKNTVPTSSMTNVAIPTELMWVDKYKPKTLKNVVGQGSETSNAKKLLRWLQNWFKYHGSSKDKPKAAWPGLRDPEGRTFKAALLSGLPGIGKTTSAQLVVKEMGYDYFELNASDTRNKKGLRQKVADALSSKTLAFGRIDNEKARKHVLIMDEVDGISGNEDRGGIQELIALIKSSRVPVICICNDRNHAKIRSLANYCYDLRFNKPSFEQLKAFVMSICFKEKIKFPQERIQQLITGTDNDVRQILHQLQLFKEVTSDEAFNLRKDLKFGVWDVIRKVFLKSEHAKMSIHDKTALFFQDYSIGPLFVQENYLKWAPAAASGSHHKYMNLIGKTAASLADGDLVDTIIRSKQNWGLLPVQAVFSSYLPGEYMSSHVMGGVDFPQWLGKNSNKNKRQRFLQGLHSHLHLHVSGSLQALNLDYLPYFRRTLTKPLIEGHPERAAKVMEEYTLLREDFDSIMDLAIWPGTKDKNPMEQVDSRVKSAFTRQVNKEILPYSIPTKPKGRAAASANQEDDLEALMEEGEGNVVEEEEEEDDSFAKDAMVKVKTRKVAPPKVTPSFSKDKNEKKKGKNEVAKSSQRKQPSKSRKGR